MARKTRQEINEEFNNLQFTSDFLFSYMMQDENLCKKVIELLLKIKVSKIVYNKTQKMIKLSPKSRGVRFDAYIEGDNKILDIEMQCRNYQDLPRRARYYQSVIDVSTLKKKKDFDTLKECYVIFLCKGDPLKKGLPVYSVEQKIKEDSTILYDDFSRKMFYNASAWSSCGDEEIKAFLKFLLTNESSSDFTSELKSLVARSKENMTLRDKFIYLREKRIAREIEEMEMIEEATEDGWNEGQAAGFEVGLKQGKKETKIEIAKKMLNKNLSEENISEITGLSVEEIMALK